MGVKAIQCFIFLLGFLFSSGTFARGLEDQTTTTTAFFLQISKIDELPIEIPPSKNESIIHKGEAPHRLLLPVTATESLDTNMPQLDVYTESLDTNMPQLDVITPIATVPTINPRTTYSDPAPTYSNPTPPTTPVTSPYTTPTSGTTTSSSGQSWCVASPSASQTALQVALDYACGYGGADCSAIRQGGSCFNPNTFRDHTSFAFNSYYLKNPVQTSCDFGGTAVITNTDPSTTTCQFPSASTSSSTLNTTNPTGSTVFGGSPPDYGGSISKSISMPPSFNLMLLLLSIVYLKIYK